MQLAQATEFLPNVYPCLKDNLAVLGIDEHGVAQFALNIGEAIGESLIQKFDTIQ